MATEDKKHPLWDRVEEALAMVRPSLEADGGNVALVNITEDDVVEVQLQGACKGCPMAQMTLAMGIGLLIAPPLAERMGKIQFVVVTQALSIPFLILLGFAPWFWLSAAAYYIRVALMNMSGPVYQTFVMEHVEEDARATVASLVSMSWNFGWAFSPMISGWMQVRYGWGMPFAGTVLLYCVSIYMYWAFFWKGRKKTSAVAVPGD